MPWVFEKDKIESILVRHLNNYEIFFSSQNVYIYKVKESKQICRNYYKTCCFIKSLTQTKFISGFIHCELTASKLIQYI